MIYVKHRLDRLLEFLVLKASKYGDGKRYEMVTVKRKDGTTFQRKQLVGSKTPNSISTAKPPKVKNVKTPKNKPEINSNIEPPEIDYKVAYSTRQYLDLLQEAREEIKKNHIDISNLKWSKEYPKCTLEQAKKKCPKGWRLPTIQELWTAYDTEKVDKKWWLKFWSSSKVPVIDATFSLSDPHRYQWAVTSRRLYESDENHFLVDEYEGFDDINVIYVKDAQANKPPTKDKNEIRPKKTKNKKHKVG